MYDTYNILGLTFVKTCSACPEQYDVYLGDKQVGYVRLRWGHLSADYPDCREKRIFDADIGHGFTGSFENERQRKHYLQKIAKRILWEIAESEEEYDDEEDYL